MDAAERHFTRKVDAQRWLDEVTASVVTGQYVAPKAGRITFREYAEAWRAVQVFRPSTAALVELALRRRVYPVIGSKPLEAISPTDVQALVSRLSSNYAYAHLWPDSDDRTREAVDVALANPADSLRTMAD